MILLVTAEQFSRFGTHRNTIEGVCGKTGNEVLVDTRSDSANFYTVHRYYVVKIGIARNPRDERRIGGYVGGLYTAGRKGNVYKKGKNW